MEIKIIQIGGMKTIQFLETEPDLQGVDINAEQYQKIKELARELGWEKEVDCNFRIHDDVGGECSLMVFKLPCEDKWDHFKCKREDCILQQQLKLLKEIREAFWPLYQKLQEK